MTNQTDLEINVNQPISIVSRVTESAIPAIITCGVLLGFAVTILHGVPRIAVVTLLMFILIRWTYSLYRTHQYFVTSLKISDSTLEFEGIDGSKPTKGKYPLEELSILISTTNQRDANYILTVYHRKKGQLIFRQVEAYGWKKEMLRDVVTFVKERIPNSIERNSVTIV